MIRTFTLIDTATGTADEVCRNVRGIDGVVEAYVVTGDFDVIAELEGEDPQSVLATVTSSVRSLEGVGTTRTYVCLD